MGDSMTVIVSVWSQLFSIASEFDFGAATAQVAHSVNNIAHDHDDKN